MISIKLVEKLTMDIARKYLAASGWPIALVCLLIVSFLSLEFGYAQGYTKGYTKPPGPVVQKVIDGKVNQLRLSLKIPAQANKRDVFGNTLLVLAHRYNRPAVFTLLLERGAYPNIANSTGQTILHILAQTGSHDWIAELDSYRVEWDAKDNSGQTPLMLAVQERHLETVDALLERGARLDISDITGRNAFDYARINGDKELAELLKALE